MHKNPPEIKLVFKNEEKEIHFIPNNFEQLREYFLSLFSQKSSGIYILKIYPDDKTGVKFDEDEDFNEFIQKLKQTKYPAIFIYNESEENDLDEIDNNNIEFIKKKNSRILKASIESSHIYSKFSNPYKKDDLNQIKENFMKSMSSLEDNFKYLKSHLEIISGYKIDSVNDVIEINNEFKKTKTN